MIRIKLKTSLQKKDFLKLNKFEFEMTGDRDLSGYTFNLEIDKGKVINDISGTAVARDLFKILKEDAGLKEFMANKKIKISMGKAHTLILRTRVL